MPESSLRTQSKQKLEALTNVANLYKQRFIADVLTEKPTRLYSPGDYTAIRQLLYDNIIDAISKRFPLMNDRYSLAIQNVSYQDPQDFSLDQQKKAIMQNKSLGRRLRGSWVLRSTQDGKVVARTGKVTLMKVPYMTDRGTFIRSGNQYTFNNIMRLEPGVYTKRNSSDQITAQFNVKRGTGAGFSMRFVPSTGMFSMVKGTRNAPAYTVLHSMGVTDQQMKDSWGEQLFDKNKKAGITDRAYKAEQQLYKG